jgi:hypothetical protein
MKKKARLKFAHSFEKKAHKNEETLKIRNCQQIKKIQNSRTEKKKKTAIKKTPSQKITFLISLFFSAFRSEKKKKKKKKCEKRKSGQRKGSKHGICGVGFRVRCGSLLPSSGST